jgi:autotransporter-associated beta strand protein
MFGLVCAAVVGMMGGRAEAQSWTPSNITVAAWYDAADAGTVLTSGSAVTNWLDKSGNNRHVAQTNSLQQPSYASSMITFNDTSSNMLFNSSPFVYAMGSVDVYMVAAVNTNSDRRIISETSISTNSTIYAPAQTCQGTGAVSSCMSAFVRNDANATTFWNTTQLSAIGALSINTNNLYHWRDSGTSFAGRVAGGSPTTVSYTRSGTVTVDKFAIGAVAPRLSSPNGSTFVNAGIREIVITGILSDANRERMEGYLAHKWGLTNSLPSNHPYKNEPPLFLFSVTVTAPTNGQVFLTGSSVTAAVEVVAGTMPYDVTFYTNSAVAWSTNSVSTNLFNISLSALADGPYTNYATVTDSVSSNATSSTNTFTLAPDTTAPTPNPMTFAVAPASINETTIVMTATTASDPSSPVAYFFENVSNSANSGWVTGTVWTNSGLTVSTAYGYTVKARDALSNETTVSSVAVATAQPRQPITVYWDGPSTGGAGDGVSQGGTAIWSTSVTNWDNGTVRGVWYNGADSAVFGGTAGTVTLGESISISNLTFTHTTGTYTLTGSTLNFTGGTIIANNPPASSVGAAIRSNITGSPALNLTPMDGDEQFTLNPVNGGSMSIGIVSGNGGMGSEKLNLQGGAGSSGTIAGGAGGNKFIVSAGAWTLNGAAFGYGHEISGGTLTLKANLNATSRSVNLSGTGVINYNVASAVSATAATSTSTDNGFRITGGTLDQTSGAAINANASTTHIDLGGTLTFLGSNGANSDLHLGSGPVWLKDGNRQITVTDAATTLTIGGVIQNDDTPGRSLTKAGAGTLELRGVSTYTGATTVNAGKLLIKSPASLNAASAVAVNGGTLAGNGTVNGPVTVGALGGIAPGTPAAPTGTLTINNNCTITNNLAVTVNGTLSSKLVVTNALTLVAGATLSVTEVTPPPAGALVIATYNTLVGTFATINSPSTLLIDYNYQGLKQIALIRPPSGTLIMIQ